ncbi:MAG: hypothetical protein RH949_00705 [Coleofasciculus sp. A1-SPW-01]
MTTPPKWIQGRRHWLGVNWDRIAPRTWGPNTSATKPATMDSGMYSFCIQRIFW